MNANIATLKNNLSRYLKSVQTGDEVVVLDRDRPIARIVPFRQPVETQSIDEQLDGMVQRGALTSRGNPAETAAWLDALAPAKAAAGSSSLSDVLLEMRNEERW